MKNLALIFFFASPLFAQVQIGKNVQIGGAGAGGSGCSTTGTGILQIADGSGGCTGMPADWNATNAGVLTVGSSETPVPTFFEVGDIGFGVHSNNGSISLTTTGTGPISIGAGGTLSMDGIGATVQSGSGPMTLAASGTAGFTMNSGGTLSAHSHTAMTFLTDTQQITIEGDGGVFLSGTHGDGIVDVTIGQITGNALTMLNQTTSGKGTYTNLDLANGDNWLWALPRTSGTMAIVEGSPAGGSCVQTDPTTPGGLVETGSACGTGGGTGVTSVGFTAPSVFSVSGQPIISSGVIALTFSGGHTANQFLATPDGSTGALGLRAITPFDLPVGDNSQVGALQCDGTTTDCTGGIITVIGGGGGGSFSGITTGSNGTAAMTCTTGCSILTSGTGSIVATKLSTAGTTTTVLHGNASGNPTYGAVSLTADVTGALPNANLAHAATTVNSQTCTLGSTCTIPAVTPSGTPTTGFFPIFTGSSAIGNSHLDDGATTAGTITATEPISISGTPSIFTGTTSSTPLAGKITLSSGLGHFTFPVAFTSAPYCTASDATAIAAVQVVSSTTQVAVSGTGTDVVNYLCIGSVQ